MSEELLYQAQLLQQEAEKVNSQLEAVDQQLTELSSFTSYLSTISTLKEKDTEILASIGKGIYTKTNLVSRDLYVEVGSGVVLKKTPAEVQKVIEDQIRKLKEIHIQLLSQREICLHTFQEILQDIRSEQEETKEHNHEHVHGPNCSHGHEHGHESKEAKKQKNNN